MLDRQSALTVFRCPACNEYIASDTQSCRFAVCGSNPKWLAARREGKQSRTKAFAGKTIGLIWFEARGCFWQV